MAQYLRWLQHPERSIRRLLAKLDGTASAMERTMLAKGAERRGTPRYSFHVADVPFVINHGERGQLRSLVHSRNLSNSGIGLLYQGFLHVGTKGQVMLLRLDGKYLRRTGCVVACRHLSGRIHEIGFKFDESIEIENFINEAVRDDQGRKDVLRGRTVVLLGSEECQHSLNLMLDDTGLNIERIGCHEALARNVATAAPELVLIDYAAHPQPETIAARLRAERYRGRIAVVGADAARYTTDLTEKWHVDWIFVSPLDEGEVREGLQWLLEDDCAPAGSQRRSA